MKITLRQKRLIWQGLICPGITAFLLLAGLNTSALGNTLPTTQVDGIVVSATRTETPPEHIANSYTVITAEEIELKGYQSVYDVLKNVPGLALSRCGGPGQYTTVRMRGGQDRHIKLLLNGSAIGDQATGITPHYDLWNFLTTDDIERIEIVRGAQSALYGSDAISGIINIITKKGKGDTKFSARSVYGSKDTYKMSAGFRGEQKGFSYNLSASHNQAGGVLPHDEFKDDTVSTNLGYQFNENADLNLSVRYSDTAENGSQSSTSKWKVYDDPNNYRYGHLFFSNMDFTQKLTSFWEHKISLGYDHVDKTTEDLDDGVLDAADGINDNGWKAADHLSVTKKAYWQNNFFLGKFDTLTAGIEYENIDVDRKNETTTSVKEYSDNIETKSLYIQNQLFLLNDAFSLICGGRMDDHSAFGQHTTFRIGSSYLVRKTGTKLMATYGTGFAPPSVFNLADPTYGNPDLKPEESESWDVGFEQKIFGGKAKFGATYFHNDYENLIVYDSSTSHYANRETAESYGVESSLSVFPTDDITMTVSYTYTDGEEDGKELARVPKNDWKINLTYSPGKLVLSADVYFVGDRLAHDQKEEHRMDSYTLVNLAGSYQVTKLLKVFVQIDNLFDERYQTAAPYDAMGFCAYGGVQIAFPVK